MDEDGRNSVDILIDIIRTQSADARDVSGRLEAAEKSLDLNTKACNEQGAAVRKLLHKADERLEKIEKDEKARLDLEKAKQTSRGALYQFILKMIDNKVVMLIGAILAIWLAAKLGVWDDVSRFFGGRFGS